MWLVLLIHLVYPEGPSRGVVSQGGVLTHLTCPSCPILLPSPLRHEGRETSSHMATIPPLGYGLPAGAQERENEVLWQEEALQQ